MKTYNTLEDIRQRKEQLADDIAEDGRQIGQAWSQLFTNRQASTRGEYVANLLSYSFTAFDAFLALRKLRRNYAGLFGLSGRGRKR